MKLKYIGVLTIISILFTGAKANAGMLFDLYAGATIGAGAATMFFDEEDETHSAQSYGAVIGIDIPVLRFELEYDYLQPNNANLHLGMINAYAKLPTPIINPYIGAGIGNVFGGKVGDIDVDSIMTYQGMLGATFDIPVLPLKIDAEGRVLYTQDLYKFENEKPDLLQYELRLKLRYIF